MAKVRRHWKLIALLVLLFSAPGIIYGATVIKSGAGTDQATVDTNKNLRTTAGASTRPTYICSAGGLTTTALYSLSLEAPASPGFKLAGWCVGVTGATAAAAVTVTVQRRTTASTGGTAATAEGTATPAMSKMDPADGNFGGRCVQTATLGTAGAVLDQQGFMVGEIGAGAADPPSISSFCKYYDTGGSSFKMPTVSAGTANGISISVSAPGAGGLASGSISAIFIAE